MQSGRRLPMFLRKVLPPFSGSKNSPSQQLVKMKKAELIRCLLGLILYPEDGSSKLLRNFGKIIPDYTASHLKI
jgi:hypothetical protein